MWKRTKPPASSSTIPRSRAPAAAALPSASRFLGFELAWFVQRPVSHWGTGFLRSMRWANTAWVPHPRRVLVLAAWVGWHDACQPTWNERVGDARRARRAIAAV